MRYIDEDRQSGYNPGFVKLARQKRESAERIKREAELLRKKAAAQVAAEAKKAALGEAKAVEYPGIPKTEFQRIERRAVMTFGIRLTQLRGASRTNDVVLARQFMYYWACRRTSLSTPQIGRLIGGRDHTSVLAGVHAYRAKRARMGRHLPAAR